MPNETSIPAPKQPNDEWQELAHEAREQWDLEHPGVAALYEEHVIPKLRSKGLGHLAISKEEKTGGQFLHEQNKGSAPLHNIQQVEFSVKESARKANLSPPRKPAEKLAVYLKSISGRHSLITNTPNDPEQAARVRARRERQIRHHTIDPVVASREHAKTEARILYEQGQGADLEFMGVTVSRSDRGILRFDISDEHLLQPEIIQKGREKQQMQANTLSEWVEYLNGPDTKYPDWFKFYAIDGVTKLGAFDKERNRFSRRDSNSLAPFPQLSRGALAKVRSWVEDARLNKLALPTEFEAEAKQKSLKSAVNGGNFGQLYVLALDSIKEGSIGEELRNITEGEWKLYQQGSDPSELYGDLQGFGLDWCTSTDVRAASEQIDGGDFYVFHSNDELGNPRIPRIAIRMEEDEVAEVRGIDSGQELEPAMTDTASEVLKDLPGGTEYVQRAADMKRLTALDELLAKEPNIELTSHDVAFIYELNHRIRSFGYDDDPRIKALQIKTATAHTVDLLEQIDSNSESFIRTRNHVRVHGLMDRANHNPNSDLSDDELLFAYGFDGPIQTLDSEEYSLAGSMDRLRSGRDRERLLELIPAAFERQYQTSLKAYEATARSLGVEPANEETLQHEFFIKSEAWQKQGVYQYVLEQHIEKDTQFHLVITPNILASLEQITAAAEAYSQSQPEPMSALIPTGLFDHYSNEELSGALEQGASARFSIMPGKFTPELGLDTVAEQQAKLEQLRDNLPHLVIRIPSMLDAISYWQSLSARGFAANSRNTTIRHIDLRPGYARNTLYVPRSNGSAKDTVGLVGSLTKIDERARVLLG